MKNKIIIIGRASINIGGKFIGGIAKHIEDLSYNLLECNIQPIIWDFRLNKSYTKDNIIIKSNNVFQKMLDFIHTLFITNIFSNQYKEYTLKDKFSVSLQLRSLCKLIQKEQVKTIHIHSLNRPITNFLRIKFPEMHIIVTDHGVAQFLKFDKNEYKFKINFKSANKIIIISDYSLNSLKNYKYDIKKIVFLPNPINLLTIPFFKKSKEKIIFFNGLNKSISIKNIHLLALALNRDCFFNNYELIAIVNRKGADFLNSKKWNFKVTILEQQSWDEIIRIYKKSKILVVPSKTESFGLVYLEALATGTPIVGFHQTLREFKNVLKIDFGSEFNSEIETNNDLATKIKKVINTIYDTKLIRDRLMENYDWREKIHEFIKLYKF